ncbi:putative methyltransferase-domain-containing protein [Pisolithus thermaeus]|nr:putative methyltransferase-domain-containing protein [Pisolithus croceorrhizus]KAI6152823.1 putative methyltransferase-domain-containing protein [Pisolithus thermaeus]
MVITKQPTSFLPPIAKIASYTSTQLLDALTYLKLLYNPEVRGSHRIRSNPAHSRGSWPIDVERHRSDEDDGVHLIRSDTFERSYTIRWLIALVARMEDLQGSIDNTQIESASTFHGSVHPEILIQQAASLLALCSGVSAAGTVERVFSFDSGKIGRIDVRVTDIPIENQDYRSVGAQTWGGACVLAEMIVEHPEQFGLDFRIGEDYTCGKRPLRVLELGAGTGLVGLTATKVLVASSAERDFRTTVVATDFYPSVLDNLRANIDRNFPGDLGDGTVTITSHFLDWSKLPTMSSVPELLSEPFDVVFGADIVYEADHAAWIKKCLERLLHHPCTSAACSSVAIFHLVIPLRPTHLLEAGSIETTFRWTSDIPRGDHPELAILSRETILCEAYRDRDAKRDRDVVEYLYYRIGWSQ